MTFLAFTGLVNFLCSSALGILVYRKCPHRAVGAAYAVLNLTVASFSAFYFLWQSSSTPASSLFHLRMLTVSAFWINQALLYFNSAFFGMTIRRKRMLYLSAVLNGIFSVLNFTTIMYSNMAPRYGLGYWPLTVTPWFSLYLLWWHGELIYAFWDLIDARRRLEGHARDQVTYMIAAFGVGFLGGIVNWPMWYGIYFPPYLNILVSGYTLLMSYAIVKHRLLDMTIIIRRTLIYSIVTAALAAVYITLIVLITHVFERALGHLQLWGALLAAGTTTMVYLPLHHRVQKLIDNKFFRFRIDREAKLMEFSLEIVQQGNTEHLTQSLCRTLDDSLHPKVLGFYLQTRGAGDFLEVSGRIPPSWDKAIPPSNRWADHFRKDAEPVLWNPLERESEEARELQEDMERLGVHAALPLVSRTDILGFLLLGEKRSEESYTNDDLILMRIIANQAAVAYERPRLLREVSSGFVHEVKMPLSKISLPAELTFIEIEQALKEKTVLPELLLKIQRRMKYIMDQAFLAGHRVDALQQLGSMEIQKREPVRLDEIILKSVNSLDESIRQARVTLSNRFPKDLPPVPGDFKQLEIVFVNLIKNAVEAMNDLPAGKPREIRITGRIEEGCVVIGVSDTGQGIKPGDHERIFQSHYTTKGAHGAGMGLFLSRQIIQMHGGTIAAASSPLAGTEFVITLPLVSAINL